MCVVVAQSTEPQSVDTTDPLDRFVPLHNGADRYAIRQEIKAWRGQWTSDTRYRAGDIVSSVGSAWISTCENNRNSLPTSTNVKWNLVVQKGDVGFKGDKGDTGARGDVGAPGAAGIDGTDGNPGMPGEDGLPGVDGIKGDMGGDGPRGADGMDGVPGPQGDEGAPGPAGTNGLPGSKGESGVAGFEVALPRLTIGSEVGDVELPCESRNILVDGTSFRGTLRFPVVSTCPDVQYHIVVTGAPVNISTSLACVSPCNDKMLYGTDLSVRVITTLSRGLAIVTNDAVDSWFILGQVHDFVKTQLDTPQNIQVVPSTTTAGQVSITFDPQLSSSTITYTLYDTNGIFVSSAVDSAVITNNIVFGLNYTFLLRATTADATSAFASVNFLIPSKIVISLHSKLFGGNTVFELFNAGKYPVRLNENSLQIRDRFKAEVLDFSFNNFVLLPGQYYLMSGVDSVSDVSIDQRIMLNPSSGLQILLICKSNTYMTSANAIVIDSLSYNSPSAIEPSTFVFTTTGSVYFSRKFDGCRDTNNNGIDFNFGLSPIRLPRNSNSTIHTCP